MSIAIGQLFRRMFPEGVSGKAPLCYVEFEHKTRDRVHYQSRIVVFGVKVRSSGSLQVTYRYVDEDNLPKETGDRTWTIHRGEHHVIRGILPIKQIGVKKSLLRSGPPPLIRVKA